MDLLELELLNGVWLLYFLLSIGVVGSAFAYAAASPFFLLGYVYRPALRVGDRVLGRGIRILMSVQPWLNIESELDRLRTLAPHNGRLLVSNHRSHLDAFLLLSRVPGIRIFAKRSLFSVPFLGMMMRLSRQIPVERGRLDSFWTALEIVRKRLRDGETVHVFPEMTRCPPGHKGTLEFSIAPFLMAMQEGKPVVPIAFSGTDNVWPKGMFGLRFRQPIRVKVLEPLNPRDFASAEALRNEARRRIEAQL